MKVHLFVVGVFEANKAHKLIWK